ncbi:arsenic transport integral membrane protein ArsB [soil metagenome]
MKSAILGAVLLAAGGLLVATGTLAPADAAAVGERVWPILLFVVAITVVTELAAEAELFRVVAERAAGWGRGRAWLLWLFVVAFAVLATVFLSLDTTAVLLTPVVVLLARHVGLPPIPFALTTVWLANTASLLLPVSNLTNLLAQHALGGISPAAFVALMWAPALAAILVPVVVLFLVFRRQLVARYVPGERAAASDRVLLWASAVVVVLLLPALVSGAPVWIPASIGALVLVLFFAVRRPGALKFGLVPWQLVVLASGLFLVVEAAHSLGLTELLSALAGRGEDFLSLLRLAGASAAGANVVNNLPAYLAFETVAHSPLRIAALLIGVNAGCLITPWASLATLLWHGRLKSMDVEFGWGRYVALGLVVVPLTVAASVGALFLVVGWQ